MGQRSWGKQPHTLAQFARRAGISEGRARALYHAKPSGLPKPDSTDADNRPLWWPATIDAWCRRTNREVTEESLWIFRSPPATSPPVELQRGVVELSRYGRRCRLYAIVWDTEHGHVIYLQRLGDTGEHRDWLAVHAAKLIEPRWWSSAVVVMPQEEALRFATGRREPCAEVYRLTLHEESGESTVTSSSPFAGLRQRFARTMPPSAAEPCAVWESQLNLADIATVLGTRIPVWMEGTQTAKNAESTLAYDRTFIVPDTTTEWPQVQARLEQALRTGMPAEFPAGFAALAVDAGCQLSALRTAHAQLPDTGEGWYLVCRPAKPAPPVDLEQRITTATLVTDLDLVAKELTDLRTTEGELDFADPRGEPYAEAITLLSWQVRKAAKDNGAITDTNQYVPVADDDLVTCSAPWEGPVVNAWIKNLTRIEDLERAVRLRGVRKLLGTSEPDIVREIYRDDQDRYVLVVEYSPGHLYSLAEWPQSLDVVSTWTDKTVLAADDSRSTVTLLALTPTDDGQIRTDPVPLTPSNSQEAFAYGYGGGTPATTYRAILRCALGDTSNLPQLHDLIGLDGGTPISQLWQAICTTKGPLRLSWPQVQIWAQADRRRAIRHSGEA